MSFRNTGHRWTQVDLLEFLRSVRTNPDGSYGSAVEARPVKFEYVLKLEHAQIQLTKWDIIVARGSRKNEMLTS